MITLAGSLIKVPYAVSFISVRSRQDSPEDAQNSDWVAHRRVAVRSGGKWCRLAKPGHGGSHVIFSASGVREIISVPAKRPIKPVYIRQFLALIDSALEVKQDESKSKSKP